MMSCHRRVILVLTIALVALLAACGKEATKAPAPESKPAPPAAKPIGAVVEIKAPLGLPPVSIPADNPPTAETIALGRRLYYDKALSVGHDRRMDIEHDDEERIGRTQVETVGKDRHVRVGGNYRSVVGKDLKWGEFLFPLHGRWYSALQMNAANNPVEEFSTREYGRFGFFFNRDLKKDESLELKYRFLIREAATPAAGTKRSADQIAQARKEADAAYAAFVRDGG